jgi:hypothetical protein
MEPPTACASIVASPAIGVCRGTDDLRSILRARFAALGVSYETVDHIAGLPTRYTCKLLGVQPQKQIGPISFDALLGAAGIKLIAVEDPEALDRVRNRLVPLQRIDHTAASRRKIVIKLTPDFMRKIGALGGRKSAEIRRARAAKRKALSELKRRAALNRWQKATEQPAVTATA